MDKKCTGSQDPTEIYVIDISNVSFNSGFSTKYKREKQILIRKTGVRTILHMIIEEIK